MTVCIAALANSRKKAVLVADKMTVGQGTFSNQNEEAAKIVKINDGV